MEPNRISCAIARASLRSVFTGIVLGALRTYSSTASPAWCAAELSDVLRPMRPARAWRHLASERGGKPPFLGNRVAIEPPRISATMSMVWAPETSSRAEYNSG
jgi:hypothetical protein